MNLTGRTLLRTQRGFSVVETLVVMTILLIMITIGLSTYAAHRSQMSTDLAAEQVVDLMRDAYQRALAGRTTFVFEITPSTNTTPGTARIRNQANEIVREEALPAFSDVAIGHPDDEDAVPTSPFNFEPITATSANGQTWRVFYRMNGQATNAGNVPQSGTIVFIVPAADGGVRPGSEALSRAITVFGPTGSIRYWRWDDLNGAFVPR